jgi:molybdenum cofactor cytidylyltransferase
MIPGIVLAAGASSRMGRSKALLPAEPGGTLLGRVLATLADAGVDPLIVVTRAVLDLGLAWPDSRAARVRQVVNPLPDRGQLSSLWCGLDALGGDPEAVLVTLVDVPLARTSSVAALLEAWQHSLAAFARLCYAGRHGHPVIFGARMLASLRTSDPDLGAKPVVRAFEAMALDVDVDDPGVVEDIDTPDDYARLVGPLLDR